MKGHWLVWFLILGAASAAGAQTPAPAVAPPKAAHMLNWEARPSGDDIADVYPRGAALKGLNGAATMHCGVTAKGTLQDCVVVHEDPEGEGFGVAELKLARRFRMRPTTGTGESVSGGSVTIPIHFSVH